MYVYRKAALACLLVAALLALGAAPSAAATRSKAGTAAAAGRGKASAASTAKAGKATAKSTKAMAKPGKAAKSAKATSKGAKATAKSAKATSKAAKVAKGKAAKGRPAWIEHRAVPGDSLYKLALQYGVTVKELRAWNKLKNGGLYVGDVVKVRSTGVNRALRRDVHVVKRGETLGGIAKKYGVTVADLLAMNRLRSKHLVKAGQQLLVYVDGQAADSKAIGRPQDGRLVDGVKMRTGPGYYVRTSDRAWGTWDTVHALQQVAKRVQKESRRKSPHIFIGDISKEGGGELAPHKSHQNGRDVDISFMILGDKAPKNFKKATAQNLDLKHTWLLLRALIESRTVEVMFIDHKLQVLLRDYVKRHAASKYRKMADELFQHPARTSKDPLIRHEPGHQNHIHIRFKTPADLAG